MSALPQPEPGLSLPRGIEHYLDVAGLSASSAPEIAVLALVRTLGLGPGSRIALPVWGCAGVAEALQLGDHEILPLDVDPETGRLDVSAVARETQDFELLWMHDVNGLPPEAAPLSALARARDALVVEEVRESVGAVSQGRKPGACADAVLLRGPDRRVRVGSVSAELVEEAALNLPRIDVSDPHADSREGSEFLNWLDALPGRLAGQRRLAAIWEAAWGPLDALSLPVYSEGTRGTWPRYAVRLRSGGEDYPNAAWVRWLKGRHVRSSSPTRRLALGLDPDEPSVRRNFPGAVEYLKRALQFSCDSSITLKEAERTVYAVDELARREAAGRGDALMAAPPDASVVIPAYGKPELTRQCLEALFRIPAGASFEVILVDNASPVALGPLLSEFESRIRVLRNETNLGFSRACNQGAQAARGRHLLFLNNDTEVRPGWLAPLVRALDDDPSVAMAGSKLLYPDGTIQHAGVALSRYDAYPRGIAAFHPYRGEAADRPWVSRRRDFQAVTAACCLVRRSVFESLKGFDPAYWNGYEDVDLCFRIGRQGLRICYEPDSVVVHHESMGGQERFARADQNVRLLNLRWGGRVLPDDNRIYLEDGFLTRWTRDAAGTSHDVLEVGPTSIVVVVRQGSGHALNACLSRLEECTSLPREVWVAWADGEAPALPRTSAARLLKGESWIHAVNVCLRAAQGRHVVLLDARAGIGPAWLEGLLAAAADHISHGLAGPKLAAAPGMVAPRPRRGRLPARYPEVSRLRAECLLVRAEVLERVGELDQGLHEDLAVEDLCVRAAEAGFRLVMAGDVTVGCDCAPARRVPVAAEQGFILKWGVSRHEYFVLGHRPLRRPEAEPETGDPRARELLARASRAVEQARSEDALRDLAELDLMGPPLPAALFLRALLHRDGGELPAAAAAFAEAARLAPGAARPLRHLAETLRVLGCPQDAVGVYGRLLKLCPQDPQVLAGMGDCLEQVGRTDMATQCYRLAHALAPRDAAIRDRARRLGVDAALQGAAALGS